MNDSPDTERAPYYLPDARRFREVWRDEGRAAAVAWKHARLAEEPDEPFVLSRGDRGTVTFTRRKLLAMALLAADWMGAAPPDASDSAAAESPHAADRPPVHDSQLALSLP